MALFPIFSALGSGPNVLVLPDDHHPSPCHVGHGPWLADPEAFNAALLDFLATQRVLH